MAAEVQTSCVRRTWRDRLWLGGARTRRGFSMDAARPLAGGRIPKCPEKRQNDGGSLNCPQNMSQDDMSRRWVDYENEFYLRRWFRLLRWRVEARATSSLSRLQTTS